MAQLGYDVSSIFGLGILPVSPLSVPWKILKDVYVMGTGRTDDKSKATDDLVNSLGIVFAPQFRFGKKALSRIQNIERGYRVSGAKDYPTMETTVITEILDMAGLRPSGPQESYDLLSQMYDVRWEYNKDKRKLVLDAIRAIDKKSMGDLQTVYKDARKKGIPLTSIDISEAYQLHRTKTYLQQNLERMPKHLRPLFEGKIADIESRLHPSRAKKHYPIATLTNTKPLWSAPPMAATKAQEEEEEEE